MTPAPADIDGLVAEFAAWRVPRQALMSDRRLFDSIAAALARAAAAEAKLAEVTAERDRLKARIDQSIDAVAGRLVRASRKGEAG